jgi:hypothetical protein
MLTPAVTSKFVILYDFINPLHRLLERFVFDTPSVIVVARNAKTYSRAT